jgi:hypothetical protein
MGPTHHARYSVVRNRFERALRKKHEKTRIAMSNPSSTLQ